MELRDAIAIVALAMTVYLTIRIESLKQKFSTFLSRYDLLFTERFKCLEKADDRIVDVQLTVFNAWSTARMSVVGERNMSKFTQAMSDLNAVRLKSTKYFAEDFNQEFEKFCEAVTHAEFHLKEYITCAYPAPILDECQAKSNKAVKDLNEAIPVFRKVMSVLIQKGLEKEKKKGS